MSKPVADGQGDEGRRPAASDDTPAANTVASRDKEQANEGYRRRGRLAVKGEPTPIKDAPLEAPEHEGGAEHPSTAPPPGQSDAR